MAFNPFTSFRKYQKFWMATILLMSMVTFVLCTGVGGDLSDWLIRVFAPRSGQAVAEVYSSNVYRRDLEELRMRRNIADLFMRDASKLALKRVQETMKDSSKILESKRQQILMEMADVQSDLTAVLRRPRYFEGGVKYADLLDFMIWLHEADRLGVTLDADSMKDLVFQAVHGRYSSFDEYASRQVQYEVRQNIYAATDELIYRSLHDEFRVQIAQLALMGAHPNAILRASAFRPVSITPQIRRPVSPEQIWQDYRKQRSEFNVALVPVKVDDFLKDIRTPNEAELQDFYERYRDSKYDPTTDEPSFKFPPRMKVQCVSADPESPFYRHLARTATTLEITPALAWTPMLPAPLAAARYAAQSAAWDASLERNYENLRRRDPRDPEGSRRYLGPPLTASIELALASLLDKTPPAASVAALVGTAVQPGLAMGGLVPYQLPAPLTYQTDVYLRNKKALPPLLAAEAKKRWPLAASVVLSCAASEWLPVGQWILAPYLPQYQPLDLVRSELREKIEVNLASGWTSANMLDVKNKLNTPGTPGNKKAMESRLAKLTTRFGLEVKNTQHYYNRYDIDKAPSLQPLLKSYEKYYTTVNTIEGRAGTELMLKEDEFWRLFFDSSIGYSIENAGVYVAKPWPPYVKQKSNPMAAPTSSVTEGQTIPLFEQAQQPFLFWQTEFEAERVPTSLDEVRDKVVYAWKHKEAREKKALPRAKQIALALQRAGKDLQVVLDSEAAKLGHDPMILRGIAPLVPIQHQGITGYVPYELPKGRFVYARDDMVKELLELNKLSRDSKEAIKIGNRELDDLNEELLRQKMEGKQVQVLTNRPRSNFYVAVVTNAPEPRVSEFSLFVYARAAQGAEGADSFVAQYQDEAGKAYRTALMEQLRKTAELKSNAEAQKSFDSGS
jgi:hypothetical protein